MVPNAKSYIRLKQILEQDRPAGYSDYLKDMYHKDKPSWRRFRKLMKQYQHSLSERIIEQRQTNIEFNEYE